MIRRAVGSLCLSFSIIASLFVVLTLRFGSLPNALRYYQGMVVVAHVPGTGELPSPLAGESLNVPVTLENLTGEPVTVYGAKSGCRSCAILDGLPVTLTPRGTVTLPLEIRTHPSEAGKTVEKSIEFFTSPAGTASVLSVALEVSLAIAPPPVLIPEPDAQFSVSRLEDD